MEIGAIIGSYRIESLLGRGGMGAVYVGTHQLLGREAAIKVLLPSLSDDPGVLQRFFNEARAASAIKHPSIVEIYDYGRAPGGSAYIVMELCDGESLGSRLRRLKRLPLGTALALTRQIASALAVAHAAGIIHRDLKPDNVFVVKDSEVTGGERIKLLDFGVAKLLGDLVTTPTDDTADPTVTGQLLGTPYYMAPEQCRGAGHVDHRADLYSLGCMLYQMVTGQMPFTGEGTGEIIAAHIHVAPRPPRELAPNVPVAVDALILKLLAKSPDDRFATADTLVAALTKLASEGDGFAETAPSGGEARPRRKKYSRRLPVAAVVLAAIAVASVTWVAWPGNSSRPPAFPVDTTPGHVLPGASVTVSIARQGSGAPGLDVEVSGMTPLPLEQLALVDTADPTRWAHPTSGGKPESLGIAIVASANPDVLDQLEAGIAAERLAERVDDGEGAFITFTSYAETIVPHGALAGLTPAAVHRRTNDASNIERNIPVAVDEALTELGQMHARTKILLLVSEHVPVQDEVKARLARAGVRLERADAEDRELPNDFLHDFHAAIGRITDRVTLHVPGAPFVWDGQPHELQLYADHSRVGTPTPLRLTMTER